MIAETRQALGPRWQQIVEAVEDLPVLPTVATRVLTVANDPDSSMEDVCEVIRVDASLTARVLRIVNSSYYGFSREIGTVTQAAVILGTNELVGLALGSTALRALKERGKEHALESALWSHAAFCGVAARVVAAEIRYRLTGLAFVAGLLHDAGKLILLDLCADEFPEATVHGTDPLASVSIDTEQELFGADHAQIGAAITRKWDLPSEITEAVAAHHRPERAPDSCTQLTDTVNVANHLAWRVAGRGDLADESRVSETTMIRLQGQRPDFDETFLMKLSSDLERELEHSERLMALLGEGS